MFNDYISNTYRIKRIPFVVIILIIWSIIISLIPRFNPIAYDILFDKPLLEMKWTWLTNMLLHGECELYSMMVHLCRSVIALIIFGFAAEKILGHARTFLIILIALIASLLYCYLANNYVHGASQVILAFFPIPCFIVSYEFSQTGVSALKKPVIDFILIFLIIILFQDILIPFFKNTNVCGCTVNTIALMIGIVFCFIWHEDIKRCISSFKSNKSLKPSISRADMVAFVALLILSVYLTTVVREIPQELTRRQLLKARLLERPPSSTRDILNWNSGRILVEFEEEMFPAIYNTIISYSTKRGGYQISFHWKWLDTKTLYVEINDILDENVNFCRFGFRDLKYITGEPYGENVIFEF